MTVMLSKALVQHDSTVLEISTAVMHSFLICSLGHNKRLIMQCKR